MPPVNYKPPLPVQHKAPKGRIIPLIKPNVALGDCLVTQTPRRIKAEVLEKVSMALKQALNRQRERLVTVHATYPVTKKPDGVKMGQGKGRIHHHVARVPAGYPIVQLPLPSPSAGDSNPIFAALKTSVAHLPVACSFKSQHNNFQVDSLTAKTKATTRINMQNSKRLLHQRLSDKL